MSDQSRYTSFCHVKTSLGFTFVLRELGTTLLWFKKKYQVRLTLTRHLWWDGIEGIFHNSVEKLPLAWRGTGAEKFPLKRTFPLHLPVTEATFRPHDEWHSSPLCIILLPGDHKGRWKVFSVGRPLVHKLVLGLRNYPAVYVPSTARGTPTKLR